MKLLKDWFPAMVRRLSITLTDMTSNFCLCASGSQGGSEDLPQAQQVGEGVDKHLGQHTGQAGHLPNPALLLHSVPLHILFLPHQSADQGEEHHPVLLLCLQYQAPLSIPPSRQVKDTAMSPPAQISAQTSPTCPPSSRCSPPEPS